MIIDSGIKYDTTYGNKLQVLGLVDGFKTAHLIIPEQVDGKKVIQITPHAFENNIDIEKVWLPESLEFIGDFAFAGCTNLENVGLTPVTGFKQTLTLTISHEAFSKCSNLTRFLGRKRIVTLKTKCFEHCVNLQTLQVHIQQVDKFCFFNCVELRELTFSPSARLGQKCLSGSVVKKLSFKGDGIIPQSILDFIQQNNLQIQCTEDSNLEKFAYLGYYVEIYKKDK